MEVIVISIFFLCAKCIKSIKYFKPLDKSCIKYYYNYTQYETNIFSGKRGKAMDVINNFKNSIMRGLSVRMSILV